MKPPHGAWCQLADGFCVDLAEPDFAGLSAGTLARHLAGIGRWSGGTAGGHAYSVAQHTLDCLEAARLLGTVPTVLGRAILLHDAHEMVTGDIPRPVKTLAGPGLRRLERRLDAALARRFGQPWPLPPEVAAAVRFVDDQALATEARDLLAPPRWEWGWRPPPPLPFALRAVPAERAETDLRFAFDLWGIA